MNSLLFQYLILFIYQQTNKSINNRDISRIPQLTS